jgi:mannose-6-phosphate isomerase-like protein (cupin superfamily)
MTEPAIFRRPGDLRAFRIAEADTNYFACVFDPLADGVRFTLVVEIFEPGGSTPWNTHAIAEECFFVLAGSGIAECNGATISIGPGDSFTVNPGAEHKVINTGPGKLYCLTFMTPNEGFAELIRSGIPVALGDDDIAIIEGRARA